MEESLFRLIPKVDELLKKKDLEAYIQKFGQELVVYAIRGTLASIRAGIRSNTVAAIDEAGILTAVQQQLAEIGGAGLTKVINGTGVILHTNLGRAPMNAAVIAEVEKAISGWTNLEFDLKTGKRGKRTRAVLELLKYLTGAESCTIVNNNAAAVFLSLAAIAYGSETIISRGELIEIGGSFRIPDIMALAGTQMREVGTTNRTKPRDYTTAINEQTKVLFKAHRSNFFIGGFTEEVDIPTLASMSKDHGLCLIYDLGAGLLCPTPNSPLVNEPNVSDSLKAGADLVLFSGDKLLGGPQCGIIAGKRALVDKIEKHPLMRSYRVGKLTIAALAATLKQQIGLQANKANATLTHHFIERPEAERLKLAQQLQALLKDQHIASSIVESTGKIGGGTSPELSLKSYAINLHLSQLSADQVSRKLLALEVPLVGVIRQASYHIDMLCIEADDLPSIVQSVKQAL